MGIERMNAEDERRRFLSSQDALQCFFAVQIGLFVLI